MATKTTVGDRVKLKDGNVGVVRFNGEIKGKKGVFYGVELDEAKGKNNGSVNKVAYFKCKAKQGVFTTAAKIAKTNAKHNADAPRVQVGDVVKCTKAGCKGTIKFIGTPYSVKKEGVFYGIALDKPKGKNDGTVKGRWYFDAKKNCGTFLAADGFTVDGAAKKKKAAKGDKKKTDKKKKEKAADDEKKEDVDYVVGDKVEIKPNRKGQIRWIGEDKEFGEGEKYYGIRLTEKRGDCDGEWKERRKFYCPEGFGQFVKLTLIKQGIEGDFDFMNEDEKYEEELRQKAEVYKKEQEKLQQLRDKFNEIDTDGNQMIDRAEFNRAASFIFGCTTVETNALFREIDVNDSQTISFAEFDAWIDKLGGIEKLDKSAGDDANKEEEAEAADKADENAADDNKEEPAADAGGDSAEADKAEDAGAADDENADKAEEDAADADKGADEADKAEENEDEAAGGGDEAAGDDAEAANEEEAAAGGDEENAGGDEAAADDAPADDADAGGDENAANEEEAAAGGDEENAGGDEAAAGDDENAGGDEAAGDDAQ